MTAHHHPQDKANLTLLMQAIRSEIGSNKLLTMAVTPNPHYYQHYEITNLANICDWVNLMAYDYNGAWPGCNATNFNAPLFHADNDPGEAKFNIHSSVQTLLDSGLPRHMLVMGLSFYGRGLTMWILVPMEMVSTSPTMVDCMGRNLTNMTQGAGVYDFYDLRDNYIVKGDWQDHYSSEVEAAWLYSPSKQIFIGFDSPNTIWAKFSYIASCGLGGAMIWDLSMDRGNQLLYTTHEALKPDGLTVLAIDSIPSTASGSSWSDEHTASGKITAIKFCFNRSKICGMQVIYGEHSGNWHGSSTDGWSVEIGIPPNLGICQVVIYLSSGSPKVIQAVGLVYTNGTSTVVGRQHSQRADIHYFQVPYGGILSYLKGKSDGAAITQISCCFKTIPGEDFTNNQNEEDFLQKMVTISDTLGMRKVKDVYAARGKIDIQPQPQQHVVQSRSTTPHPAPPTSSGMQTKIVAGNADWLIGYALNVQHSGDDGTDYNLEYALRLYAGFTIVQVGEDNNPRFRLRWNAPVVDLTTSYGLIVKNGDVSITGTFIGQGGTIIAGESGIAFQGTLGNVTLDTAIGREGLKLYGTTANAMFGGGFEIGPNKLAIGVNLFGFPLNLDFGAILNGKMSWEDIGKALLNGMIQLAYSIVKSLASLLLQIIPFGFILLTLLELFDLTCSYTK